MIMPQNLFAACRDNNGQLVAKRVRLDANVQNAVETIFAIQEDEFRSGADNEVAFDGRWKLDDDEIFALDVPAEGRIFVETINANAMAIADLNTETFADEGIKALFTGVAANGTTKVLIQRFTAQQVLGHRFAFLQQGNAFRRLTEAAFTLDNSLTCLIENGKIKFKSQHKLRSIIDFVEIYRAATDQEVRDFAGHAKLEVADPAAFVSITNQVSRKLIHAITSSGTLEDYTPTAIQAAAAGTGLAINVRDDKIVMPQAHADIKALLQFLNECRYSGPLSGQAYVTNSQRPA